MLTDSLGNPLTTKDERRERARREWREQYQRQLRARYDAAQTTVETERHWSQADGLSARAAGSAEVRRRLRERARYEVANDSYASGMVVARTIDVIGSGPRLMVDLENREAANQIARRFGNWAKRINLGAKLRTVYKSYLTDGEGFLLSTLNRSLPEEGPQLDYRLYEADQIATPYGQFEDETYIDGVHLDNNGVAVKYDVLKYHPGDVNVDIAQSPMDYDTFVAGEEMLHLFRVDRPGQIRGIPHLTPALSLFAKRRRFALATITAAETAANFAAILFTDHAALTDSDIAALDDDAFFDLPRGSMPVMPMGYKIAQLQSEHPADTYEMFDKAILQEVARCFNMPLIVAIANSQNANYASGRLDYQGYRQMIRVERQWLECCILDRIFEHWLEEAAMIPNYLPAEAYREELPHRWYFDPQQHVDPQKEASAFISLWEKGLAFDEDYFLEVLGRDPDSVYAALERQNERREELGLPFPGQAEEMQREQAEAQAEAAKIAARNPANSRPGNGPPSRAKK